MIGWQGAIAKGSAQRDVLNGVLAGAAGTLALNAVTYADIAIRGRPPSQTPEKSVERLADAAEVDLGSGEQAKNRKVGLASLLGYATGVATAVAFAVLAGRRRLPLPVAAGLLGAGAMFASDASMAALKVTDPRRWSRSEWISDAIPHLAYGATAAETWRRLCDGAS